MLENERKYIGKPHYHPKGGSLGTDIPIQTATY
jgi:hypothetical protein